MENDKLYFFKGSENVLTKVKQDSGEENPSQAIREAFSKILDGKNLSFLLGSGCSSLRIPIGEEQALVEIGIPTMVQLAYDFYKDVLPEAESDWLKDEIGLDIGNDNFKTNIESFLGSLHSLYYYYESTGQIESENSKRVSAIIKLARNFLILKCLNETNTVSGVDLPLLDLYKSFYRKLLFRSSNLAKPNIFTTNYDLYSETALDKLGIYYVNGFSGGIKKYFNPTIFNYALAEKMDLSQSKWSVIDNFIYLYKVHGSLNWVQADNEKLFKVREIQETTYKSLVGENVIMIHPTPLKQNASLGSPYSDLFREFQKKLMQNNNVLVSIGYSFSDEHINNLIYQAFTIPSFRLIVLGEPKPGSEIEKLKLLDDPRIWVIGGTLDDGSKLHYFKGFVNEILPDLTNDQIDKTIENTLKKLFKADE